MASTPHNLEVALRLADAGAAVFPCSPDKRPIIPGWPEHSTCDERQIRQWWTAHPGALPAIDCGKTGICVVDLDRHGDADGVATFKELIQRNGDIPRGGPLVKTPGNGYHLYWKQTAGEPIRNTAGRLAAGVDTRALGGYVIGSGARLPDGREYSRAGATPDVADALKEGLLPEPPQWFLDALRPPKPVELLPVGNGASTGAYARKALEGEVGKVATAPAGARNATLNSAAFALGQLVAGGELSRSDAETALLRAASVCGLSHVEASATINSGIVAGMREPRTAPQKVDRAAVRAGPPEQDEWSEPLPIKTQLPPVKPFDADLLPDVLLGYVLDVADRQQAPPDFAAVTAVCGLAALVGNDVRIKPKGQDDWAVVPNLWGAIIGRPSAMKSPAIRASLAPVYAIQDAEKARWDAAMRGANIDRALAKIGAEDAAGRAKKAMKNGDKDQARRFLAETMTDADENVPCPRTVVNDATVEKLGELLNENPRGLLLVRDELSGFLARMHQEENQSERAFYLEAFNGDGSFTYDRIGRGTIHIEHATVSIIGGIQPSRIAPLVRGAFTGEADDGLLQRFQMIVWPDDLLSWTWIDRRPNAAAKAAYQAAFQNLHDFARGRGDPLVLSFAPDAQEMFREWMLEIQTEARAGALPGVFESHLLKLPKTVASLALIFELLAGGRETVGAIATGRALDWADYLRSHAARLYGAACFGAENGARLILDRRDQLPNPFTAREVQRKGWAGLAESDTVGEALDRLVGANCIRAAAQPAVAAGGRPSTIYFWNPKVRRAD